MSTVNVLRYSALGLGFLVGFQNDWSLKRKAIRTKEIEQYNLQMKLIEDAKREYANLHAVRKVDLLDKVDNMESINLDDPNLDFNKLIESWVVKVSN